jgi:hypothetical protein
LADIFQNAQRSMSGQQQPFGALSSTPRKDGKTYEPAAIASGAAASGHSPEPQNGGYTTGVGVAAAP